MKTYSPKEVDIIIGTTIVENWESITVALDEDEWTLVSGADGEVTRTENANKLGTITLSTKQASEANLLLSAQAVAGSIIPITIRDKNGYSIHSIAEGVIAKRPDAEYGKEAGDREWMIKGKLSIHIVGGN